MHCVRSWRVKWAAMRVTISVGRDDNVARGMLERVNERGKVMSMSGWGGVESEMGINDKNERRERKEEGALKNKKKGKRDGRVH